MELADNTAGVSVSVKYPLIEFVDSQEPDTLQSSGSSSSSPSS